MKKRHLRVLLAETRGFCAGVVRAVEIVDRALDLYGPPIYVRNKIVHNRTVVTEFEEKGVVFVKDIGDVPLGAITIFSAHGVSRKVVNEAGERSLQVIDATCPLVTKVHNQAKRYSRKGYELIMIAHEGHPEVEGTVGQVDGPVHIVATVSDVQNLELANPDKLAYVTQTTLGVDDTRDVITALVNRFPNIIGPDVKDICYATQNRQTAVRTMAKDVDVILIIGAHYSSNSCRLREIGEACGADSYLVPDADGLDPEWLSDAQSVGISAGASAPEKLVQGLIARLGQMFDLTVEMSEGVREDIQFNLPRKLSRIEARAGLSP